jgi:asparagine N-glycosylation enzyme membrane subunit Stt3
VRRTVLLIAAGAFFLALGTRLSNAPVVFDGDVPRISVLDDLYHFKRMAFTAAHFPRVLGFDPDRGERGAFCPWPPLYDFAAATIARVLGASTEVDVLRRVVWFPPLFSALFIAVVSGFVTRRFGWDAGATLAVALSASPLLIAESSLGNIDHHFLEAPLTFAIVGATLLAVRPLGFAPGGRWPFSGVLLGAALVAAMFVQPALIIAAGLAFFVLFFGTDRREGAVAFGIAAVAIAIYRLMRPPGYPDSEWFLGWTHVALFAAAAAADGLKPILHRTRAFALGGLVALPVVPRLLQGLHFLGGDAWLRTIVEFQPVWRMHGDDLLSLVLGLGGGAVLVWPLARERSRVALFAIVYLVLTITSRRFCVIAIPLLALGGTMYAARLSPRLRRLALLVIVIPVVVQFAMWQRRPFGPVIGEPEMPWIRAAAFLRHQTAGGRVLAPWSMGHTLDVIGGRPVIIDNFGTMSDEGSFNRAHDAFLAHDEESLWRYCRAADVRFVVLDNPVFGLQGAAATLGLDANKFAATKLATRTWWWRAYYGRERAVRRFRLAYVDPQPSWRGTPVLRGPALMIWERNP